MYMRIGDQQLSRESVEIPLSEPRPVVRLFRFEAIPGRALPAVIVVAAADAVQARELAAAWCRARGIKPRAIELAEETDMRAPGVVFGWDGDY